MALRRREINKDVVQQAAEAVTASAQRLSVIVLGATRQVITEVGDLATELFEISDAAGRARRDADGDETAGASELLDDAADHPDDV
ncbi:hypothetical protein CLV56_0365 [Mumia flava]|uniref:Uncharacterized protein n=1 Tax=Mumia flava TaxID=1348852 RepID=A0A2M9BDX0_9ACTN|nr:hypothetical protein [Mumia flava]PJJ56161.1 hypothetical protein CLV56_0365 [Mumia flava]